ncbi:MAG: hypothetical protein ACRDIY_19890, partial [Chloroflexota bacterium]
MSRTVLPTIIVVLALVDAVIHLFLAVTFFHLKIALGNQLSYLFPLDFIALVVLVVLFLRTARSSSMLNLHRVVGVLLIVDPLVEIIEWVGHHAPNPMGFLGDGAKAIEVVL